MEIEPIKILKTNVKFHYKNIYKKWKLKVCEWIGVAPIKHFSVEMTITIDNIELVDPGIVIRFEDYTQARILSVDKENNSFVCWFYEILPTTYFQFNSSYFYLLYRKFSEK